jgi:hypothetical protein
MFDDVRREVFLFGLTLSVAGCSMFGAGIRSWPERNPAVGASSGVLFKLDVDADIENVSIESVRFYFPRLEQYQAKNPVGEIKTAVVRGDALGRFPNDVLLIPLPPGDYYGMTVAVDFDRGPGTDPQRIVTGPGGGLFQHFTVAEDKVTVLGAVRDVLRDHLVLHGFNQELSATGRCTVSDGVSRRLEVADAALARPEAERLHWRAALESARADVLASGDFADAYELKSWPSRAPSPGGADHPATGVLFRVKLAFKGGAYPLRGVKVYFRRADQTDDDMLGTPSRQYVSLPGARLTEFPNDVVLVPLSPGRYAGANLVVDYGESPAIVRLRGDFGHFDVQPGKLTVLEDADLKFDVKPVPLPDGKSGTQWHADVGRFGLDILDPDPRRAQTPESKSGAAQGRRGAVEGALARPEADALGWREALEAAKADLLQ